MLSVETVLPDIEELHKLVEQGQEKGFLTYDEIVNALEDVELTKEQLEEFTTYATDHSIELVEGEQHKRLPHEPVPVEDEKVVRLPQGVQVLHVRDVVDPPGGHPCDRRQGTHDPDPGAHGGEAEQGRAHRAAARAASGP
jgi:hypothetical protein